MLLFLNLILDYQPIPKFQKCEFLRLFYKLQIVINSTLFFYKLLILAEED